LSKESSSIPSSSCFYEIEMGLSMRAKDSVLDSNQLGWRIPLLALQILVALATVSPHKYDKEKSLH
jgi:hypothetical protein